MFQARNTIGNLIKLVCIDQLRFSIFSSREIKKMFNINSNYFCILNNTLPATCVAHVPSFPCLCYSSIVYCIKKNNFWIKGPYWHYVLRVLTVIICFEVFLKIFANASENFAFLNLRNIELCTKKVSIFLNSRLLFKLFYCFCIFTIKNFAYLKYIYLKKWNLL